MLGRQGTDRQSGRRADGRMGRGEPSVCVAGQERGGSPGTKQMTNSGGTVDPSQEA